MISSNSEIYQIEKKAIKKRIYNNIPSSDFGVIKFNAISHGKEVVLMKHLPKLLIIDFSSSINFNIFSVLCSVL
jgi:hypothetical protein